MSIHSSLQKKEKVEKRQLAPVIHIRVTSEKTGNQHGIVSKNKANKGQPLFYTEPIFKAKKHDPL